MISFCFDSLLLLFIRWSEGPAIGFPEAFSKDIVSGLWSMRVNPQAGPCIILLQSTLSNVLQSLGAARSTISNLQ